MAINLCKQLPKPERPANQHVLMELLNGDVIVLEKRADGTGGLWRETPEGERSYVDPAFVRAVGPKSRPKAPKPSDIVASTRAVPGLVAQ